MTASYCPELQLRPQASGAPPAHLLSEMLGYMFELEDTLQIVPADWPRAPLSACCAVHPSVWPHSHGKRI